VLDDEGNRQISHLLRALGRGGSDAETPLPPASSSPGSGPCIERAYSEPNWSSYLGIRGLR
jgi:hypothetical protein